MDNLNEGEKKIRVTVGAFIFNDKGELFLVKSPKWQNKYVSPGGGIEYGEEMEECLVREVKEETNMRIDDIEFLGASEGVNLGDEYSRGEKHLIFLNFKAFLKGKAEIKLNGEAVKYKWLKPEEWLKKDLGRFTREVLEKYLLAYNDYEGKYKRALADYQNLLKRTAEEKKEFAKYANEGLLREFLPVYDNLKISMRHIGEGENNGWTEGIKYVIKQFKDALNSMGVEEIETEGKNFDPVSMEAVEGRGEKVKKEVRPGYLLNGKVIVPAKVVLEG
jgi:molecular chaperone GrpE (heat shock protein)